MQHRVTYTTDRCTITLFTFHDGHLGIAGAKRFLRDIQRQMPDANLAIVTEPEMKPRTTGPVLANQITEN